jgi:hypothetical protein
MSRGLLLQIQRLSVTSEGAVYEVRAAGWRPKTEDLKNPPLVGTLSISTTENAFSFEPSGEWKNDSFPKEFLSGGTAKRDNNVLWESLPKESEHWWFFRVHQCAVEARHEGYPELITRYQ